MEYTIYSKKRISSAFLMAGIGIIISALMADFIETFIMKNLIDENNVAITVKNIVENKNHILIGILGDSVVVIVEILVAMAFYKIFKQESRRVALLTSTFRMFYAGMLAYGVTNLISIINRLDPSTHSSLTIPEPLISQINSSLEMMNNGLSIGLIFFGIHLVFLGYLFSRSNIVPRILSILMFIAACGSLADGLFRILFIEYRLNISSFTIVGEYAVVPWLLIKARMGIEKKQEESESLPD